MPEVAYNQALTNKDYYGYGIVSNRSVNLNLPGQKMMKGGIPCDKRPISYPPKEKVNRNYDNHYEDYLNESIDSLNFEERNEDRLERGLSFSQNNPNENFDFNNDGIPDLNLFDYKMPTDGKSAEVLDDLVNEPDKENEPQPIAEKSTKVAEPIVSVKEPELKSIEQQELKKETPQNQLKDVTANATDKQISMSDGIIMGIGGLALATLILGRV